MLFVLTGKIQEGKTRWLSGLTEALHDVGVTCHGVLSLGLWRTHEAEGSTPTYEKLGIEALLLPDDVRIPFAWRRDLAPQAHENEGSQSNRAGLHWVIPDEAIDTVNQHLAGLLVRADEQPARQKGLLIIDELGILELQGSGGFTSALELLRQGRNRLYQHALVVVRAELLENAVERFKGMWDGLMVIAPDATSRESVFSVFEQ